METEQVNKCNVSSIARTHESLRKERDLSYYSTEQFNQWLLICRCFASSSELELHHTSDGRSMLLGNMNEPWTVLQHSQMPGPEQQ